MSNIGTQDYFEWIQEEFNRAKGTRPDRALIAFGIICSSIEFSSHDGEIASEFRKAYDAKIKLNQKIYQTA